ncbi:MAG: phosphocholine cytidylyltransferase family protein [Clostridia bacterium]|nr:phosphocholine cytidylyltransferase family protein [Clostridia bacterium]
MKALILNSGLGSRMGELTKTHPKCMTEIAPGETIVSRQLKMLCKAGVTEIVMTTGVFEEVLREYCDGLKLPVKITYVRNPIPRETNYIYSIYCAREELEDEILLMHGDLVFEESVLKDLMGSAASCMAVSSAVPLPEKDFKAVVVDGIVQKVGIEFFECAVAAQPLYHLSRDSWELWLNKIIEFCEAGNVKVYAENALNELDGAANIVPLDVGMRICGEIDNPEDLAAMRQAIRC